VRKLSERETGEERGEKDAQGVIKRSYALAFAFTAAVVGNDGIMEGFTIRILLKGRSKYRKKGGSVCGKIKLYQWSKESNFLNNDIKNDVSIICHFSLSKDIIASLSREVLKIAFNKSMLFRYLIVAYVDVKYMRFE
jgi:hypothetical protein